MEKRLAELFKSAGYSLNTRQIDSFAVYYGLLEKYNDEFDLTRLKRFEDIAEKHFIDSMMVTKLTDITGPLLDIGTGAGFPGVPIKILMPGLDMILSEPKKKRVEFLKILIRELELDGIEIYPHMITDKSHFKVNSVITRAFEPINETLRRVDHFLPRGGTVIFMKGPEVSREIEDLDQYSKTNFEFEGDTRYVLPGTSYDRRLVSFKKITDSYLFMYRIMLDPHETIGVTVTSADNKRYKKIKGLLSPDGIRKQGMTTVHGKKMIQELIDEVIIDAVELIIYDGYGESDPGFDGRIKKFAREGKLLLLKKALYSELDVFNTSGPLMVIKTPELHEWDGSLGRGCSLMVPFQDPENVGSVIRSAVGFGIDRIILLREAANPFHPKSVRASSGAVFKADMVKGPSIMDLEKYSGAINIIPLDKNGTDISVVDFPESFALLPGIEGPGLPEKFRKAAASIPVNEKIESLNTATAASIAMYVWSGRGPR
ncbi:MAG: 16S rRNA (guanine(527)-N(7))-methyltransferase RsmG [Spirochaetes bacterium]|nr:16S rRNA (guanine(527)-N(7))-methyltransferase RsmG [Spirochaetota bacterium]